MLFRSGAVRQNRRDPSQGGRPAPFRAPVEPVDPRLASLVVSFLPERRGLAPLANRLAKSFRAYSLFEVSTFFLSKPDYYLVKIEAPGDLKDVSFFLCSACKALFLDKESASTHVFAKHFDKYCTREEQETEPPKGNFMCVARCKMNCWTGRSLRLWKKPGY